MHSKRDWKKIKEKCSVEKLESYNNAALVINESMVVGAKLTA